MASNESRTQSNLHQQDLTKLDIKKLSPLSPEVISRQATINIGTIGHVAHGKSTVVKAISGVQTVRFKNELERNITIKLERLPDAVLKMYQERAQENCELLFLEKLKNSQFLKKRKLSLESTELEDIEHKKKKNSLNNLEDNEYIVEKILDFKFQKNELLFYIKWKGWPDSDNTWEPIENLNNCQKLRRNFIHIIEEKYCEKFEKLKKKISKGDLLAEEKLLERFQEIEDVELFDIKDDLIIKLLTLDHFCESNETHIAELVQDARNSLQMYVLLRKRCHQLMSLSSWEELINHVDKDKKITIENNVDLAGPPEGFVYINESIPGVGVTIPKEPPIGCECIICNCRSRTCCGTQGGFFAYTSKKILRVAPGTPIYECNKACKCSSDCCNRVVQSGRNVKLCIFKTPNGCGWGVRTDQKIKRGQFVCQYIGEVITFDEAEKRGREYDANGLTYLFDLDFNSIDNPYTIDAASLGNVSHFINHSCDPNLGVWAVWADCLDPNLPMLALFAIRDIEEGEELCFDYLQKSSDNNDNADTKTLSYTNGTTIGIERTFCNDIVSIPSSTEAATTSSSVSPTKSRFEMQQENLTHLKKLTECKCGSLNCRKYLF